MFATFLKKKSGSLNKWRVNELLNAFEMFSNELNETKREEISTLNSVRTLNNKCKCFHVDSILKSRPANPNKRIWFCRPVQLLHWIVNVMLAYTFQFVCENKHEFNRKKQTICKCRHWECEKVCALRSKIPLSTCTAYTNLIHPCVVHLSLIRFTAFGIKHRIMSRNNNWN